MGKSKRGSTKTRRVDRRSRVLSAISVLAVLASLTAIGGIASGAPPGAVDGIQNAYRAITPAYASPGVTYENYYFKGTAADQVNKALGTPTATFDQIPPTGLITASQNATPAGAANTPGDPFTAFWKGPFSGSIDGNVELRWWWSSTNPGAPILPEVDVTFFADPDGPAEVIGQARIKPILGTAPSPSRLKVRVKGTVSSSLMIQVRPVYSAGHEVHYSSETYPSGFGVPVGAAPPVNPASEPQTQEAAFSGPMLELRATYIGHDALEPTLAVLTDGTAVYAAAGFEPAAGVLARTDIMRSKDGNLTWHKVTPPLPSPANSTPPVSLDPMIYVDNDTDRIFSIDLYVGCSYLNISDDGGDSWLPSPFSCGRPVNDHQTITTGPPPPGLTTIGYPNVVYYCVNQVATVACTRSLDGGFSWLDTASDPFYGQDPEAGGLCGGLHGHIETDREGRLFLPKGHCDRPYLAISEDAGATWSRVRVSDMTTADHHTAVAADDAGNLYYVWWDAEYRLPWMAVSTDHGQTWGDPLMVAPPGVREVNFPDIEAGAEGRVALSFPGTETNELQKGRRPWNLYVLVSENALAANPLFLSATGNVREDPIHRGTCQGRCAGMFDFLDVKVAPSGEAWAAAVDTCTLATQCITDDGSEATGAPSVEDGVAIRQIAGPALAGPAGQVEVLSGGSERLAATGVTPTRVVFALLLLAIAAGLARFNRRKTAVN